MPITLLKPAMMLGLSIVLMNDVAADATTDATDATDTIESADDIIIVIIDVIYL